MNASQHRPDGRGPRLTYRPVGDSPNINTLVTIVISMIIGAIVLGIVEVGAIAFVR